MRICLSFGWREAGQRIKDDEAERRAILEPLDQVSKEGRMFQRSRFSTSLEKLERALGTSTRKGCNPLHSLQPLLLWYLKGVGLIPDPTW
jgi:hypothetical protein